MKKDQSAKWLKVAFFVSICIFFLTSVDVFDYYSSYLTGFYISLNIDIIDTSNPLLYDSYRVINIVQYLELFVFLAALVIIFWQKQNWQAITVFTLLGLTTLFTVWILSVAKNFIDLRPPMTGGGDGSISLDQLTVYVSTLSGFIAAVSGLYGQIVSGRKALAEVELEKLRLQTEQAMGKRKSEKKKSSRLRK